MTTTAEPRYARNEPTTGGQMHALAARLYPICRSITGRGVRESLAIIRDHVPVQIRDVPSGTQVFDWTIPKEWNIRDAYVANAEGERVIDFRRHNLHVVQYSRAVRARMTLDELMPRLHTLPDRPDAIPYRTSYYKDDWGFCLADRQLRRMAPGDYEVVIDAALEEGRLTYGELHLAGERDEEILFHTHICHPSLANDNLSGLTVATFLAMHVAMRRRRYSYRFLFLPGLIGPLTWLALNEDRLDRIRCGLVLTGVGDRGPFTYKRSRRGDATIDRAMPHLLAHGARAARTRDFDPYGYDERQYCSPGFNLPVGALMRSPHGSYPEYHTSGDDLGFITPESLGETLELLQRLVHLLESDRTCRNLSPKGEPQLGKRGLYRSVGGAGIDERHMALLWVLNLSDGTRSLLEIAERSGLPFHVVEQSASELESAGLVESERMDGNGSRTS